MPGLPSYSDCLIVGAGIAGLSAALAAADQGLSVDILLKTRDLSLCNTWKAQGGIVGLGRDDTPEMLAKDIKDAGNHLNCSEAVDLLAKEGPALVNELLVEKAQVDFDRNERNELELTREGAHSTRRIYHHKDLSGQAIMKGLLDLVKTHPNIRMHPRMMAVDIITNCHNSTLSEQRYKTNRAIGLFVYHMESKEILPLFSPSIVLATGGIGEIYKHSSNPSCATGDGIAMAYRAGADIINAEYVQFHPTTLYHRDERNFLVTEALRGEGARLVNRSGEPFMERYHRELKDLAPRDEVSRAIYKEMDATNSSCVFLDARDLHGVDPKERFPGVFLTCSNLDIDIRTDPIPVVPAAHYFCGGVKVNLEGQSQIAGLYAVGETACTGVHGANRLASVSLLEGLYFGYRCGEKLAGKDQKISQRLINSVPEWQYPNEVDTIDPVLMQNDMDNIRSLMWNYTGIIRSKKRLRRALSDLNYLNHRIERFYREAKVSRKLLQLRNSLLTAFLVTRAASSNHHSLGCHYIEE